MVSSGRRGRNAAKARRAIGAVRRGLPFVVGYIRIMSMTRPLTSFRGRVYGFLVLNSGAQGCRDAFFGDGLSRDAPCRLAARRTR